MGVQLSWQSTCPASRGSSVRTRLPPPLWAHSSAGQSTRLISVRSMVRVHLSPPNGFAMTDIDSPKKKPQLLLWEDGRLTTAQQDKSFYQEIIKTSTKRQNFHIWKSKANLVNKARRYDQKRSRSPTSCEKRISRVRRIEFLRKTSRRKRKIKLQRAYGECLGTWRRRRT